MSAFLDIFRRKGNKKGDKKSPDVQRQNTVAQTLSTSTTTTSPQRRATLTGADAVAKAFQSGDPDRIAGIMERHVLRVTNATSADNTSQLFGVTEHPGSKTRRDSSGGLHEMKTFNLSPVTAKSKLPQFTATYFPMTDRDRAWSGTAGDEDFQKDRVTYTRQQSTVALTSPITGCTVTEDEDGHLAHIRPYTPAKSTTSLTSEQEIARVRETTGNANVKLSRTHTDVFGSEEYHRYDMNEGLPARQTNALVVADPYNNKRIIGQTIYGGGNVQKIGVWSRPFGPQPQYHMQEDRVGDSPSTPQTPLSDHHLKAPPRRDHIHRAPMNEPRPPTRRHSITQTSSGKPVRGRSGSTHI